MQTEIEAKFLAIDHEAMRLLLRREGAQLEQPMRVMRRVVFEGIPGENAYLRVRDEGDKVTLTYKKFTGQGVDGAQEIEITVGNYTTAVQLMEALGFRVKSEQESRRETWRLADCEIVLDEWP